MPYRFLCLIWITLLLTACAPAAPDLANLAAAEATQIVQQAQATALIQNARATANVLLTPSALVVQATPLPTVILVEAAPETAQPVQAPTLAAPTEEISHTVKLLGLSFGANNNLLSVQFLAPVATVQRWQQGNMYLIDEATGQKYEEIPVMPVVGVLFARPTVDGQPGYVMFTNLPVPLQTGAVVTVVLGNYRWEHIPFPMQSP